MIWDQLGRERKREVNLGGYSLVAIKWFRLSDWFWFKLFNFIKTLTVVACRKSLPNGVQAKPEAHEKNDNQY